MDQSFWFDILQNPPLGIFVKLTLLFILIFYLLFTIIVLKQIQMMNNALTTGLGPKLKSLAIVQIFFALAGLLLVLFL